jgi:O-antigen/teichoic acid export membrane protein
MAKNNELGRGGLILLIMISFSNLLNYLFQVLMGHMLTIAEFGTMNALFSLYAILSLPFGVMAVTTARYVATYHAGGEAEKIAGFLKQLFRFALLGALGVMVLGVSLSPLASRYMNINNTLLMVLLSMTLALGMIFPLVSGAVQGTKQFLGLGVLNLGLTGIKLVGGVFLVWLGFHLYGVMGALIGSILVMTIIGLYMMRSYIDIRQVVCGNREKPGFNWRSIAGYAAIAFVINLWIALLSNVDMVFVKRFFTENQAGLYATAVLFGRLVLYIPSALVLAMFPIAAEAEAAEQDSLSVGTRALLYVGGLAVLCAAGLNLFTSLAVKLLMGEKFLPAVPYVRITALMAVPVGLMVTLANFCLAIKKMRMLTISMSVGCIACWAAIELYHSSIYNIVAAISITATILFVYNLIYLLRQKKRGTSSDFGRIVT